MEVPDLSFVEVRETPKGRGVFARTNLAPGTPVIVGKCQAESKLRTRYTLQMNFGLHVDLDEPGKLVNHSCDPNTYPENNEFGGYTFTARRNIAKDEEITFDYDMSEFFSIAVPECLCQSARCRGRTRGFINLPPEKRNEYGKQIAGYARRWRPPLASLPPIDTSTPSRFIHTAYYAVTDRTIELFRVWARAAAAFPKDCKILDICPGPSLLPALALSTSCTQFEIADFETELLGESLAWKESAASFDWSPFVLLALLSQGLVDPSTELISGKIKNLQQALTFSKLALEEPTGKRNITRNVLADAHSTPSNQTLFDVINISDPAYFLPTSGIEYESGELSVKEWVSHIQDLLKFLKPGGHLLVTLPPDSSLDRVPRFPRIVSAKTAVQATHQMVASRPSQLTAGTCLEALQAPELGLSIVFNEMTSPQEPLRQTGAAEACEPEMPIVVLLSQKKHPR